MCKLYSLDESSMVDEWMAFACSSQNDIEITLSALESFEKEVIVVLIIVVIIALSMYNM